MGMVNRRVIMDELEGIRHGLKQLRSMLNDNSIPNRTAMHWLAKDIDTLTRWIVEIAKKIEMQ